MTKYRVIQYGTGSTGKQAIRAFVDHPELELVGCLVHSPEKVGLDAGEIAGVGRMGVICTDSVADIVAMDADAVSFMGLWPDLDLICSLLESGKHVALTAGLIFPDYLGPSVVARLEAACLIGGTCVYGGGLSPGYVETIAPITLTNLARRTDRIVIEEYVDYHDHPDSVELIRDMLGLGRPLDDVQREPHPYFEEMMPRFYLQALALLAAAVKLDVERFESQVEHIVSPGGGQLEAFNIEPGTVGGVVASFTAYASGEPKIQLRLNWIAAPDLAGRIFGEYGMSNSTQWRITVEGDPSMRLTFEQADSFLGRIGARAKSTEHSFIMTAMNIVNAIPYLCEAREPGIKHHANLPLMAGRHTLR